MRRASFAILFPGASMGSAAVESLIADLTAQRAGNSIDYEDGPPMVSPRAEALVTRYTVRHAYGVAGCAQLFAAVADPATYKRKAAEIIVRIRRNRRACRRMGYDWHGADARLLAQAAACRRRAVDLQNQPVRPSAPAGHAPDGAPRS